MKSKLETKIAELQAQGWKVIERSDIGMNGRRYKMCRLEKDGKQITVNHQGGLQGIASAF